MRATVAFGLLLALPAQAQVLTTGGAVDLGFGPKGATEVSAYVDLEQAGAYATLSLLRSSFAPDNEVDLAFGYYAESKGFSYDLGYRYSRFPDDPGADYGEFALGLEATTKGLTLSADLGFDPTAPGSEAFTLALGLAAERPLSDRLTATLDLSAEPLPDTASAQLGLDFALSDPLTLSAQIAAVRDEGAEWERQWQLGLGWTLTPTTTLNLRYLGGNAADRGYFALALSWDSALSSD